ncbi:B3/B4 domain-containing protein [Leucobacter komagatae]|uniref:tRNA synthetase subunit beta n=1 Tax=Leucobacter komagatae TaxID=55969 RepID=A0A0D0ILV0_9MICO|nr:phenylalanine--tRNA ligase beta subunit-related protein [Leucobacter komagatae]KIP52549.1 tRNA synthetase subunit beta [Leucobacter komagatae]
MRFQHSSAVWVDHPTLAAGVIGASGITAVPDLGSRTLSYLRQAVELLDERAISEIPAIRSWRRAFAAMGYKPTKYRCAAESLLRRISGGGSLPTIHPLVDLCNHVSASLAVPIAVFDLDRVTGDLEVRHAAGTEAYESFSGEAEHPAPGEIIFADNANRAHSRRWTNRQSAASAMRQDSHNVLIVAEALHEEGADDIRAVLASLTGEITAAWDAELCSAVLTGRARSFEVDLASPGES